MAEAFVGVVVENLGSLIKEEIGLIMGVDDEMNKLSSTLTTIQAVLEDAEQKQLESKPIQNWLCKLNDLVYEIDDILDECATQVSIMKHRRSSRYSLKNFLFRRKIGRRVKRVTAKLDDVAAERKKFHLREMPIDNRAREIAATSRETGSILNESHLVYGREEDEEKIVDILVNHVRDNQETLIVLPGGIGGLGKTTLAQQVFNNRRVVEHFDEKLWVCVSDNFDLKILIKAMIESLTGSGSASDLTQLDTLQRRLWELLNRKRYLLVLDDVWNDHQEKWYALRNVLACGSAGASIIVTTRQKKVADVMGTLPAHNLTGLSEEHCWLLLRERAFGQEEKEYPNLEAIGKEIVKKCGGVPLAAKALGGLLRFKRTEKDWIYVKESEILDLPQETLILPALRLSYHHLPVALRQCFACCAVFPKDYRIQKKELIFYWIAHGFISSRGVLEVEDVGDEVCNELVLRSLLQDVPDFGNNSFIMHDLVHDLAQSIMENKVPGTQNVRKNVRSTPNDKIRQVNLLHKYVAFPKSSRPEMDMSYILTNFSRLRILDASCTKIEELSSAIGNLKHLRHLDLAFTPIRTLPESLGSLWNLQILMLNYCPKLAALPKNTRYLKNLRHFFLEDCTSLSEMPSKINDLTGLRTLSLFVVGHNRGNQLEELQCLNLGGKLEIRHLERVKNPMDAKKANLADKKNLRRLRLVWEGNNGSKLMEDVYEKVLEALEPHPNVETLKINGFNGRCFPAWMTNSTLKKLVKVSIEGCQNCLRLPYLRELPHLKILRLKNMGIEFIVEDEVEGGDALSIDFPSLEELELCELPNLKGFFKDHVDHVMREVSPNLRKVKLIECCSFKFPPLSSFKQMKRLRCSSSTWASLSNLNSLTKLGVKIDKNMTCIPIETLKSLTHLESLKLDLSNELCVLPEEGLRALKSLTYLRIVHSKTLTCLPQGWLRHLSALETLEIFDCPKLVELPEEIKHLKSLACVYLNDIPKMASLPKALQHVSSLKSLYLQDLSQLNSLPDWLGNFASLKWLCIWSCPMLASLPDSIQGMTNLKYLSITNCPELEKRCQRGKGEDWHKIAHIPNLQIYKY
ncbi:hypothetical protein DH2020_047636 [Rehmannia glutinosa]|uniref:Disease resistance protein RGA3 n=1 Tax=Rehmannia glutinosa TaxID=99300 RepID=A0ABR0U7Z6_REHGL